MEFQGRVKKILPLRSGVSQRTGNEWKSLPFIFEYHEHETDRYADSVVLETFDTNVIDNLKEGMEICCGFGHRTREYDGKTYNELRLYKIESVKGAQQAPQGANAPADAQQTVAQPIAVQTAKNDADDDLPF
jgi:hypothetical protein